MCREDKSKIESQKSHEVEKLNCINPEPQRNGENDIFIAYNTKSFKKQQRRDRGGWERIEGTDCIFISERQLMLL